MERGVLEEIKALRGKEKVKPGRWLKFLKERQSWDELVLRIHNQIQIRWIN